MIFFGVTLSVIGGLQLFEEPSEEASAELAEWLELVVDNQTDASSAWHHCMRTWIGG